MRIQALATISIGLLAAACQAPYQTTTSAAPVYGGTYQTANAACADYGFQAGTPSFNQCVANEQQARSVGRVNRDYSVAQLTVDARNACNSYGLTAGTAAWDRCVGREQEARSYRSDAGVTVATSYTDQYGNRVDAQGYRVDANGYRMAGQTAPYYQPAAQTYSTQSVPSYRTDQYDNRVDAQGYRVDSNGNRLPVQGSYYTQTTYTQTNAPPPNYTPAPQSYSTQPVSRDEFGNRYDAQGNKVDASGRVLAMPASRY